MKTRTGFVSNSSSSSFIIAAKKRDKLTVTVEINLGDFVTEIISTEKELVAYILERNGEETLEEALKSEYTKEQYDQMLAAIKAGKEVYIGDVGSEGENGLELMIYQNGLGSCNVPDKIEILSDCN